MAKNTIYLVEVGPGELKSFDNWPDCQAFVHGKPYRFAGGPSRAQALAKLQGKSSFVAAKANPSAVVARPPAPSASKPGGRTELQPSRSTVGPAPVKNTIYIVETAPGQFKRFTRWPECQAFVKDKPYAYAGGVDEAGAMAKLLATREKQYAMRDPSKRHLYPEEAAPKQKPTQGLTSDAGTHGNPGPCEYKVTDLKGKVLDHKHLGVHSNNYAELAGIGAMIKQAIKLGETLLWTDSKVAMIWIKSRKLGPTVREPELILAMIDRINELLRANPQLKLCKWNTRRWGQIPSDFGRK